MRLEPVITDQYQLYHCDSIKEMLDGLAENSVDFAIFSPPFRNDLFAYTNDVGDMGNSGGIGEAGKQEFMLHFAFFLKGLYKAMKPGRLVACHVMQSPLRKGLDGMVGISDFRGDVIRAFCKHGFFQFGEVVILKNPQAQSIVKHINSLQMSTLARDRAQIVPSFPDYLLIFKKPGENEVEIKEGILPPEVQKLKQELDKTKARIGQLETLRQDAIESKAHDKIAEYAIEEGKLRQHLDALQNLWLEWEKIRLDSVSSDEWIEFADAIWQEKQYNAPNIAVPQKARFDKYFDDLEVSANEALQTIIGTWYDIRETDVIKCDYTTGRTKEGENSDKHICPLQLGLINRAIRLWSNPNETVLDPFCGVGSSGVEAVKLGRKFLGMELKKEYFISSVEHLAQAVEDAKQRTLFDFAGIQV